MRRSGRRGARGSIASVPYSTKLRRLPSPVAHFSTFSGCSDSGSASSWVDAWNGYSVASGSAGTRLTYSASVAELNGRPGWTAVAASSTYLQSADGVLAGLIDGAQAYTAYVVRKAATVTGGTRVILAVGATAASEWIYHGHAITTGALVYSRRVAGSTNNSGSVSSGTALVLDTYVYDGSTVSAWAGSSATIAAGANTKAPTLNRVTVGALMDTGSLTGYFDGAIGDIVIYSAAHTTAERVYAQSLISARFGL